MKKTTPHYWKNASSFGIKEIDLLPENTLLGDSRPWQLLVLSANTLSTLNTATENLAKYLATNDKDLADVAYTLAKGFQHRPYRRMLVCQTVDEAIAKLNDHEHLSTGFHESEERPIAFMFPGQSTQYINMGRELYQVELTFREAVDTCAEILKPMLALDLRNILYPNHEQTSTHPCTTEAAHELDQIGLALPAIFVISYALATLWISWGRTPQAMIGYSLGEYVAATLSGGLSLQDALMLVTTRAQLMQSLPEGQGTMLAVSEPKEKLLLRLREKRYRDLSLGIVSGSSLCMVSGRINAIEIMEKQLFDENVMCRRLRTAHAYHSNMMDPILAAFTEQVKPVKLHPPQIPYISNVTGTWITEEEATNSIYWVKHLRQTVYFASGLSELLQQPELILLEVGPGKNLSTLAKAQPEYTEQTILRSLGHVREEQPDLERLLTTLGHIFIEGGVIDWDGFYAYEQHHLLSLSI